MMPRAFESSVVFRHARQLAAGSVVCRAVSGFARLVGRAGVGTLAAVRRPDAAVAERRFADAALDDDRQVRAVLANSTLVRLLDQALDVPGRAWRASALRRLVGPTIEDVRGRPPHEQVRLAGWMLASAIGTHILLAALVAEPAGWPTWTAWLSFLALSCALVWWSVEIVAAWRNRRPWVRRLLREREPWQ